VHLLWQEWSYSGNLLQEAWVSSGHKMYNGKSKGSEAKDDGTDKEMRLTQKQYQALMALINQNVDHVESQVSQISIISSDANKQGNVVSSINSFQSHNVITWILDSGATDHVTMSFKNISSYEKINNIMVKHPNGFKTKATHKGSVQICD